MERDAAWHHEKFTEFTILKLQVGEPSPHLAIVGYLSKEQPLLRKGWYIGCYGATYCLPSAQMLWEHWSPELVNKQPDNFAAWIKENWAGIITRTERRCVRTPEKMTVCLTEYAAWLTKSFEGLPALAADGPEDYYNKVWDSVCSVKYIGRYIAIRMIEGMRRYCGIPAELYDVRSLGGWSPRITLSWMYPEMKDAILQENKQGEEAADKAARMLLEVVFDRVPGINFYVLAAMLCEYRVAIEKGKQYPGWTLDQEPLLYDKAKAYWGNRLEAAGLWEARAALFPHAVLGELSGWNGTRWDAARVLRDHGYNWSDLRYDYIKTLAAGDWANPVPREVEG